MGWLKALSLLAAVQLSSQYLLPGDVSPSHYDLRLVYDIDPTSNFSFYGVVDILLTARKNTSKIILHSAQHSIAEDKVQVVGQNDAPKVTGVELNDTYNFLEISLDRDLKKNKNYTLIIPFYGNLFIGLDGVYISTYFDRLIQKTEYVIATQFQPISARKGFPCFDEPIYKATFSINIGHSKNYTAVSNMPVAASSINNAIENYWPWETIGRKFDKEQSTFTWDQFDKSVPMPTYLVAFVVSKFSHVVSDPEQSHTKFRIWARSDAIDQTSYSSRIGPVVLSHFEKWFNVSFPLPKQDMMAIPDFVAEGMENWGLITYEETALLYHNKESSFSDKERIAELVAHELAHQWFGNLVTMKWWSDLWLNEGFATFVASLGVSAVEPDWHADHHNAIDNTLAVLRLDALESSHPVSVSLNDPDAIIEIFDDISYSKGASLIRMMLMFLGEDSFRQALHGYLIKYSYSNAEQDDLWLELTTVAHQKGTLNPNMTVKEVMDTWTKQTGYPLITVNRNYSDNSLSISQKRYLSLGMNNSTSSWWIPLRVMCENKVEMEKEMQWLEKTEGVSRTEIYDRVCGPNEWVLFNYNMIAPYRVNYDESNWQLLIKTLTSDKYISIPVEGRVQLLSDALDLAWNNQLDYGTALQLVSYLQRETEYLPLHTGLYSLSKIDNVLKRRPDYGIFQKFVRTLINNVYQKGGLALKQIVNGNNLNTVKIQTTVSAWACSMNMPGCEENAIKMFNQWMETENPDDNNPIPVDLRSIVYCVGISRGSASQWSWAISRLQRSNVAAARERLLHALACSRDVWLQAQLLEWTLTETAEIHRQDSSRIFSAVMNSDVGFYVARDFIYNRVEDVYNSFNDQDESIGEIIKNLLVQFTTQKELDEFLVWQEKNAKYYSDSKIAVSQGIEVARANIAWIENMKPSFMAKLEKYLGRS